MGRWFGAGVLVLMLLWMPFKAAAAEVLQVRTPSLLQVGDHNRTYTVRLACVAVDPASEAEALAWLKQELPRRRRVNLRPEGSDDGVLLARVTPLGEERDLSQGLVAAGFGRDTCTSAQL
jgi:endonuclease YncB( thermonuclease family)